MPTVHDAPTVDLLREGSVVAGRYALERLHASGGSGLVFRARDLQRGGAVALKVLRCDDAEKHARFERERDALAAAQHPALVSLLGSGDVTDGFVFLALEWVEGEELSHRLARGPLSVGDSVALLRRVAEGLSSLHARGLLHRDLKPANLLLEEEDVSRVRILDLGLARGFEADGVTVTGAILGTPGYLSPEQARGDATLDARTDVFALGAVLFECLTGKRAFASASPLGAVAEVLLRDAPRVRALAPEVPEALERLVSSMLARDPSQRPADADAVLLGLASLRTTEGSLPGELRLRCEHTAELDLAEDELAAILCDTDRWDRLVGAGATVYSVTESQDPAWPSPAVAVGNSTMAGSPVRFLEAGEWWPFAHGWGERRFLEGPFAALGFSYSLEVLAERRTRLRLEAWVRCDPARESMAELLRGYFAQRLERYTQSLARFESALSLAGLHRGPTERAADFIDRALLTVPYDRTLLGPRTPGDPATFEARATPLRRQADFDGATLERLEALLQSASDSQLQALRPRVLARAWGLTVEALVPLLVRAVKAGLLGLRWQLLCPSCRVAAGSAEGLETLTTRWHCVDCQRDFSLDPSRNIELLFFADAALRPVQVPLACAGSAARRPHVLASFRLEAGASKRHRVALPREPLRARLLRGSALPVSLPQDRSGGVSLTVRGESLCVDAPNTKGTLSPQELELHSERSGLAVLLLEYENLSPNALSALEALCIPGLRELLPGEAPAAGVAWSVERSVLLGARIDPWEQLLEAGDGAAWQAQWNAERALHKALAEHGGTALTSAQGTLCALVPTERAAVAVAAALLAHRDEGAPAALLRVAARSGPALLSRDERGLQLFGALRAALEADLRDTPSRSVTLRGPRWSEALDALPALRRLSDGTYALA